MRRLTLLILAAFFATACGEGGTDPAEKDPEAHLAVGAERGGYLLLLWQSVLFEDPNASASPLADLPVGALLPIIEGQVELAVTPPFSLYQHVCDHFEDCDDQQRMLEASDHYALAKLMVVDDIEGDGQLDCTIGDPAECMDEIELIAGAPGHLLLFARARFDAQSDPFLSQWGVEGIVQPGVWLVDYRGKDDASLLPIDGGTVEFSGMDLPNVF